MSSKISLNNQVLKGGEKISEIDEKTIYILSIILYSLLVITSGNKAMERTSSVLKKAYGPKNTSVNYPNEAPLIDIQIQGRKGKRRYNDEKRLTSFINTIARHSPFGRAVLEDAAKDGYTLIFENQKDSCGFCDKESRIIALNPALSDELLTATLAHESRHAQQFARGAEDAFGVFNLRSELMYTRAMEADAETAAAATCHEIRINSGNAGPWKEFSEDSVEIAADFVRAAPSADSPVTDKMLQGAFNGWYRDIPMMTAYEDGYVVDTMKFAMRNTKDEMPPYDKTAESGEIVNMFCSNAAGKCYWAENPDVLNDKDKLSIDPATYHAAKLFFKVREMKTGVKPDPTLETLKVRFDLENSDQQLKQSAQAFSIKGPKLNPRVITNLAHVR